MIIIEYMGQLRVSHDEMEGFESIGSAVSFKHRFQIWWTSDDKHWYCNSQVQLSVGGLQSSPLAAIPLGIHVHVDPPHFQVVWGPHARGPPLFGFKLELSMFILIRNLIYLITISTKVYVDYVVLLFNENSYL
jgi:hypothetical protein